jgi:hypothetical protein
VWRPQPQTINKVLAIVACVGLVTLSIFSSLESNSYDTISDIRSDNNTSADLPVPLRFAVSMSRESAVSVMSLSVDGAYISSSSGTYIEKEGKYYVLTVSHGITTQDCDFIRIVIGDEIYNCTEIAAFNERVDYAVLEVGEILSRTAVPIPDHIPKNNEWVENLSIYNETVYTGYPSGMGPITLDGRISGFTENENVYIHSFAWPGSSGSGVFNEQNKLIGFIMAINLGYSEFGITVLEDIVIVVPVYKIDWDSF